MKLRIFYRHNEKLVLGTFAEGKTQFFFSGFESAEEAKNTILLQYKGVEKIWWETFLIGEWSEIE